MFVLKFLLVGGRSSQTLKRRNLAQNRMSSSTAHELKKPSLSSIVEKQSEEAEGGENSYKKAFGETSAMN